MLNLSEELKKIFLAGVGAIALTAEKSKEIIEELVKKGEFTVEQGKVLNEELKRNVKAKIRETLSDSDANTADKSILEQLDQMSEEQIQAIKAKIDQMKREKKTDGE
jgi:polyhydroxyalkanoate synthesis regulator phasin